MCEEDFGSERKLGVFLSELFDEKKGAQAVASRGKEVGFGLKGRFHEGLHKVENTAGKGLCGYVN